MRIHMLLWFHDCTFKHSDSKLWSLVLCVGLALDLVGPPAKWKTRGLLFTVSEFQDGAKHIKPNKGL